MILYSNFSIICVTETWLDANFSDGLLDPRNLFNIYRHDRNAPHPAGGVCIFVRRDINTSLIDINYHDFPGVEIVAVNIITNTRNYITLICCYIAPSVSKEAYDLSIRCLSQICNSSEHCILIGDFNLPNIDWTTNFFPGDYKSQAFLTFFTDYGFEQLIDECTRNLNFLDLLLINDPAIISEYSVEAPFSNSDHESIVFNIYVADVSNVFNNLCNVVLWKNADWQSFAEFLNCFNWSSIFRDCVSVDDYWFVFSSILYQGIEYFVPSISKPNTNTVRHSKIVNKLMSKRKAIWKLKRDCPSSDNCLKYKAATSALSCALTREAADKELSIINSGNLGQFYKHINCRLSHKSGIAPIKNAQGLVCVSDGDKAEEFSNYFAGVGVIDDGVLPPFSCNHDISVVSDSSSSVNPIVQDVQDVTGNLNSIYFDSISVYHACTKLKAKASTGPDLLPPILFKHLSHVLILPLTIVFNCVIQFGSVPLSWKAATVVPIFKKGASSKVSNYRPISLTSTCCKVFESIIKDNLLRFIQGRKLITHAQHGFLKGRSTCTNLLESLNDWSSALNKSVDTLISYIDFSKAFDCVSVPKLIYKLQSIGIGGKVLSCISALLNNRTQRVKVGSAMSTPMPVMSGVAQGSVLGPVLFILFVNDLTNCLPPCAISKFFADDLKSYVPITSNSSIDDFSQLLACIETWAKTWQLPLSIDKCSWMLLSNRISKRSLSFSISGINLVELCEVKDLGVIFNSDLNFCNHINAVVIKAKQRLYLLRKSFVCTNEFALISAFKTYVIPLLEYCSPVWSPSTVRDIIRLESVQRSFTKSLKLCCSSMSYSERLLCCGLYSLERRRLFADLTFLYKILNKLVDIDLADSIQYVSSSVTRGHSRRLRAPPARINSRLYFFTVRTVKIWNGLSESTVCSESVFSFKKNLLDENLSNFLIFV